MLCIYTYSLSGPGRWTARLCCAVHGTGGPVELVGQGSRGWITALSLSTLASRWLRAGCAAIVHKSTGRRRTRHCTGLNPTTQVALRCAGRRIAGRVGVWAGGPHAGSQGRAHQRQIGYRSCRFRRPEFIFDAHMPLQVSTGIGIRVILGASKNRAPFMQSSQRLRVFPYRRFSVSSMPYRAKRRASAPPTPKALWPAGSPKPAPSPPD